MTITTDPNDSSNLLSDKSLFEILDYLATGKRDVYAYWEPSGGGYAHRWYRLTHWNTGNDYSRTVCFESTYITTSAVVDAVSPDFILFTTTYDNQSFGYKVRYISAPVANALAFVTQWPTSSTCVISTPAIDIWSRIATYGIRCTLYDRFADECYFLTDCSHQDGTYIIVFSRSQVNENGHLVINQLRCISSSDSEETYTYSQAVIATS